MLNTDDWHDRYCDVRTCFALADLAVPLGEHSLHLCGVCFELLTERRERGSLKACAAQKA